MSVRANTTFFAPLPDGSDRFVLEGSEVADDDPVVAGREHLFTSPLPAPPRRRTSERKRNA